MQRKLLLAEGEARRVVSVQVALRGGKEEKTGEALTAPVLARRAGWAADLIVGIAAGVMAERWNATDMGALWSGVGPDGRRLPSNAWMALRRLGWSVNLPDEVRVNDRIARMAQEQAGRVLRGVRHRAEVIAGVLATWPADPGKRTPAVLHLPTLRPQDGRVRADLAFTHAVPVAERAGHTVALGVDWGLNTLLSAGACELRGDGTIAAWGTGGMFRATGVLGRQHRLRRQSERLHARLDRQERLDSRLYGPRDSGNAHSDERAVGESGDLALRHARLAAEKRRVSAKRSNLNDALAKQAARWAVDQALAAGATVIYLEDLRSMEATGMGRTHNTRMSQTVRGKVVAWMRHLAAEHGIGVVTVPARNTSKHCPGCLAPLKHCAAPDRPNDPGWKWARCPNPGCGWQGDRDASAWRRIAARGLAHQNTTVTDRATGQMTIRSMIDQLEARAVITPTAPSTTHRADRSKTGPTPPRRAPNKPSVTTRPAPRRRGASSTCPPPARQAGRAGQRPEEHAPQGPTAAPGPLPRAAHRRHQGVTAISTPTIRPRHQPRGAALGAGFHLHAHATPPLWADPPSRDTQYDYGFPS